MRKIGIIALTLALLLALGTVSVYAKAQKVDLEPDPRNYTDLAGGGFVVFNNSSGPNNLEITVSLKKADTSVIGTQLDVYLWVAPGPSTLIGTMSLNKVGSGNFHYNASVASGDQELVVVLTLPGSGANVFRAPPFPDRVEMSFK